MLIDFINILLSFDTYLLSFVQNYGILTYAILFIIIVCETGLVVTPFLPGDSLLFTAGALAAFDVLNIFVLFPLLVVAAILGDSLNYWIGRTWGSAIAKNAARGNRFIKEAHIRQARLFYLRHGGKTIILARFAPIVRTFAPFIAGIARMQYPRFLYYNITGGIAWVSIFLLGGDFFGAIPFVQDNFSLLIIVIIIISLLPLLQLRKKRKKK